jgi:hypothetical protein
MTTMNNEHMLKLSSILRIGLSFQMVSKCVALSYEISHYSR